MTQTAAATNNSASWEKTLDNVTEFIRANVAEDLIGKHQHNIIIYNDTSDTLEREDTHNQSGVWPLGDLKPGMNTGGLTAKSFSFGAKYKGKGKVFVVAVSSPLWGHDKIGIAAEDLTVPGVWEAMDDGRDKRTAGGSRAMLLNVHGKLSWVFRLSN